MNYFIIIPLIQQKCIYMKKYIYYMNKPHAISIARKLHRKARVIVDLHTSY